MTDLSVRPVPLEQLPVDDDELNHYVCCVNDVVGLCGATTYAPIDLDCEIDCVVCSDLHDNAHEQCPIRSICIQYEEGQ